MKTAIYIDNNATQIVLTPENEFENKIVEGVAGKATLMRGGFYHCCGGWDRQSGYNDSLIIRMEKNREPENVFSDPTIRTDNSKTP